MVSTLLNRSYPEGKQMSSTISSLIEEEARRQQNSINLIASENYVTVDVMRAMGSHLTNKYAEGYPGARYYGGCETVDIIEQHAIDSAKQLLKAEHVNVQPHSGSSANMAVYFSVLKPGDTVLGMNLASGGHLTHGHPINFSGKLFNFINYNVDKKTECIDYDEIEQLTKEHRPKMIVAGASAYSRIIDFERIGTVAKKYNSYFLADIAHIAGLVAVGLHPHPFPHADFVTSTTHKTLRGPRGGIIACKEIYKKKINSSVFPGMQGGPLMHIIAAKAVAFEEALRPEFAEYQKQILANAQVMAQTFIEQGYRLTTGGTDNHLMVIDVKQKAPDHLNGKQAEKILEEVGIVVNRNMIPFDAETPFTTSGLRIGTPAITTRGFTAEATKKLTKLITKALDEHHDKEVLRAIKDKILELCDEFPVKSLL